MKVEGLFNQLILCLSHSFFKIFIYVFIYLAVLCLSRSMWELVPQSGIERGSLHWSLDPWTIWKVSSHTPEDSNGSQTSSEAPLELRHGVAAVILLWLRCGLLVMTHSHSLQT